jgi:two-component system, LytTR family, response regulator
MVVFVDPADVFVAKADGNYVALVHKSKSYLVRETMATAEQKLAPLGFLRIHRSTLVNTNLVKELRRDKTGTYMLRTTDGSEHPVGRSYKDNLKSIARSWMGVELV